MKRRAFFVNFIQSPIVLIGEFPPLYRRVSRITRPDGGALVSQDFWRSPLVSIT